MNDPQRNIRVDVRLKRAIESGTLPKDLLLCGPAGTGKTYAALSVIHVIAAENPDLRILLCRKTRKSLTNSTLVTYEQEILPADGMEFIARGARRDHRSSYHYPNRTEIVLAGMDDPAPITSSAWDIAFINEAIDIAEEGWDVVGSRLNRPGRDRRFGWLLGDTNPGDPAHWLRKRCEEGRTALWDTTHRANPAMFEGGRWTPAGLDYMDRLGRLKGTRRKRYLEGIWAAGEGQWFENFDPDKAVTEAARYEPALPVHLAVDSGVHTGAVWFQVRGEGDATRVNVFGDFYSFNRPAYHAAKDILALTATLCGGRIDRGSQDPAAKASTATGVLTNEEFKRAGLTLPYWPVFSVTDGLGLIESFVSVDPPALTVHPRCQHLIEAFANYKRTKRSGQFIDRPEEPQHPYEETMDALRGGLVDKFPNGRKIMPVYRRVSAIRAMY